MGIRGVVFDYGGVLARPPVPSDFEPIAREVGLTWDAYKEGFAKYRWDYDGDLITCEEMYRRIAAEHGLSPTDAQLERLCRADDASWLHVLPDTLRWMHELKAAGYRIGILTNMAASYFDRCVSHAFAEHIALADALVVSGKAGITKPDLGIYRLLEERIALRPDELIFFDDNDCNVRGALAAGWRAAVFSTVERADEVLRANT